MRAARRLLLLRFTIALTLATLLATLTGPFPLASRVPVVEASSFDYTTVYVTAFAADDLNCYFGGYHGAIAFNALGGAYWAAQFNAGNPIGVFKSNGTQGCILSFGFAEHTNVTQYTLTATKDTTAAPAAFVQDNYSPFTGYCVNNNVTSCTGAHSFTAHTTNGVAVGLSGSTTAFGTMIISVVGILGDDLPTATPGAGTVTATPNGAGSNYLRDGNQESQQPWLFWQIEGGTNTGRYVGNPPAFFYFGIQPPCGNGVEMIGSSLFGGLHPHAISQVITWPGGNMHVSWSAKGDRYSASGGGRMDVTLTNVSSGQVFYLDDNQFYASADWVRRNVTQPSLAAGQYELKWALSASSAAADEYVAVDDMWVDYYDRSACDAGQPTSTPTATRTPTPTRTPTRTRTPTGTFASPTPSRTPTSGPTSTPYAQQFANCGFEQGSAGWAGQGYNIALSGGPIGPQYANLTSASSYLRQFIMWPQAGPAYLTFWVGPQSYGSVSFMPTAGGLALTAWTGNNATNNWVLVKVARQLPAGNYYVQANSYNTFKWDGVAVAHNSYLYCGLGTPTAGPTSNVSATPSRTATAGASPTGTQSPVPSGTQTPNPTGTAQPTGTARPTSSPQPTHTQTGPEKTATAAGTTVATYTPFPTTTPSGGGGTGPGGTCDADPTNCPVPGQPEPAPGADCVRPLHFWEVAQWIDYSRCSALSYVAWGPDNTGQVIALQDAVSDREPFGTMGEVLGIFQVMGEWLGATEWCDTGICQDTPPMPSAVEAYGILQGNFVLDASNPYSDECELLLTDVIGAGIQRGACFCVNVLCALGILPWVQFVFNFVLAGVVLIYIQRTWMQSAHT